MDSTCGLYYLTKTADRFCGDFTYFIDAFDQQIVTKVVLPVFYEFSSPQGQPRNQCWQIKVLNNLLTHILHEVFGLGL